MQQNEVGWRLWGGFFSPIHVVTSNILHLMVSWFHRPINVRNQISSKAFLIVSISWFFWNILAMLRHRGGSQPPKPRLPNWILLNNKNCPFVLGIALTAMSDFCSHEKVLCSPRLPNPWIRPTRRGGASHRSSKSLALLSSSSYSCCCCGLTSVDIQPEAYGSKLWPAVGQLVSAFQMAFPSNDLGNLEWPKNLEPRTHWLPAWRSLLL